MRLTTHSDYGLRLLMVTAESKHGPVSVSEAASMINVSRHHLMKVAQGLTKAGLVKPIRGRSGGFQLAKPASDVRIGDVVRALETDVSLVECMRSRESDCPLIPGCRLPRLLQKATDAFFHTLDTCTLKDLMADGHNLIQLSEGR